METSRFYYLVAVAVVIIASLTVLRPFSRGARREDALLAREEAMSRAQAAHTRERWGPVSLSDYKALRQGMTYDEVAQLHGPGKEEGRKVEYYRELVTYRWQGQGLPGRPSGWMKLTFADGKLVEETYAGLR